MGEEGQRTGPGGVAEADATAHVGEDEAFSALTVVTRYPAPVAVAYRGSET